MENKKKPTNAQLQKRISNAIVHVDRTKDTDSVFFDDRGLRLTVTENHAVISTGFHDHVFSSATSDGISRPYLYTKRMIEIANENDFTTNDKDGNVFRSFKRLLDVLKEKADQTEYNIAVYFDWYLLNIFAPLYSIGENEAQTFMVYMDYMHNIAKNAILFDEHKDGLTNKQFISQWIGKIQEFTQEMAEREIFVPKTDEDIIRENIEAMQQDENDKILQSQIERQANESNG